jgi:CubicO group peptidase (beta-lactamase class C family)
MARFGLLILNKGKWETEEVLNDAAYFTAMVNTSQDLNLSYGYLWWLNGKPSAMVPQSGTVYPGTIMCQWSGRHVFCYGKNGQMLSIVPSKGSGGVRMGDNANNTLVPVQFQNNLWEKLKAVINP